MAVSCTFEASMRIAVNARFLIPGKLEGIGWYTYHVLKRLVNNHPQHEYFFLYDRPHVSWLIEHSSITHVVIGPPARHPALWYLWFECRLPSFFRKMKPDLFFSPDGYGSLHTDVPQYLVVHDLAYLHFPQQVPWLVQKYYAHFVPRHLARAKHLFAVSNATQKDICHHFPSCCPKISLATNGVRSIFQPLGQEPLMRIRFKYSQGKNYFLFVGAIHPRKNTYGLIKAYELFKTETKSDSQLVIVGRKAWSNKDFDRALEESPYRDEIHVYGYLENEELALITAAAWAAIQPSFLEGFGVPVLEALSCGVPVLVSNVFSLPEVAGPGAYLFDPNDPVSMAKQMAYSLSDPDRAIRIAQGHEHRQQYNWDCTADNISLTLGL